MSKWNMVRQSYDRAHSDLFETDRYSCEFFNYSGGSYDPNTGQVGGENRTSIGEVQVEIVPPAIDSTIDNQGTSFDWSTSIRFPLQSESYGGWGTNWGQDWGSKPLSEVLTPLGEDSERPTEVEITNKMDSSTTTYELHGYSIENGGGMIMCRLTEQ